MSIWHNNNGQRLSRAVNQQINATHIYALSLPSPTPSPSLYLCLFYSITHCLVVALSVPLLLSLSRSYLQLYSTVNMGSSGTVGHLEASGPDNSPFVKCTAKFIYDANTQTINILVSPERGMVGGGRWETVNGGSYSHDWVSIGVILLAFSLRRKHLIAHQMNFNFVLIC